MWLRESPQQIHACRFGMEAILNWTKDKENSSKNEQQIRPPIIRSAQIVSCPVKKMAFVMIFWTTYIPFVILVLPLVGRHAMRALRSLRFERLLGGDGAPTLSTRRPASAYVSCRSLSTGRLRADRQDR